ncbi:MAG: glycosyltransferase family 4 protein [Holophagales bacterium]|nr:glycosyltransferase family 4 protein [Holophagales bacterium]
MHLAYLHYLYGRDTALHHVRQFSEGARQLGHRVDVHAMNLAPPPAEARGDSGARQPLRLRLRSALKRRFGRWLHDPKEFLWNWRYVKKELALLRPDPPDCLLVRSQGLGISCVPVARRLGVPLVLEINAPTEEVTRYLDQYVHLRRLRHWAGRYKLRRAQGLVVVSTALADYYVEEHGLARETITVAPNGADLERFHPEVEPDPDFPRDPERPRIGYVGSFQKWHALDLMGRMVERVGRERPATCFLMVGSGAGVQDVRAQTTLGDDRLTFTGRVEHARVPGLVASLDIGVLAEAAPYQCPLKVIEWMAAGTAIVAPAYGPLKELLADGEEGLLFEPGDADALAAAVLRLVDDPELCRRLGRAAARRAHASLSWRDNARHVLEACRQARRRMGLPEVSEPPDSGLRPQEGVS